MKKLRRLFLLTILSTFLVYLPSNAQEKPSLHSLFENSSSEKLATSRVAGDVIVIDLAEWQNEYDETLNIATGKSYKFINGELRWIGGNDPLIVVSNNSKVSFEENVSVIGKDNSSFQSNDLSALIFIKDAEISVHGASFHANKKRVVQNPERWYYMVYDVFSLENEEVGTENCKLSIDTGNLYGSITCESQNGLINITNEALIQGGIRTNGDLWLKAQPIYKYSSLSVSNGNTYYKYKGKIDLVNQGKIVLNCNLKRTKVTSSSPIPTIAKDVDTYICNIKVDDSSYLNNPRSIVVGGIEITTDFNVNIYNITNSDVETLDVENLDLQKYELVLKDNVVYIQEKSLTGQQWLQEQINSFVDKSTDTDKEPGIIAIPEDGVTLTNFLFIPSGAFVKLVGGPITISKDFSPNPDMVVRVDNDSHLLIDNVWDFNSLPLKSYAWIFANTGHLSFGENSKLLNTWSEASRYGEFIYNNGLFDFDNPKSKVAGNEIRINGSFVDGHGTVGIHNGYIVTKNRAIAANTCVMYDGIIESHDHAIVAENFYMYGGFIASSEFDKGIDVNHAELIQGSFHTTSSYVNTITSSGNIMEHTIVFKDNDKNHSHCLFLTSQLYGKQRIKVDWKNIDFSTPYTIVVGKDYQITQQDCDNFVFENLPQNVRAKLESNTIILTKEKKNLHDMFNNGDIDGGTEDKPANIMDDENNVESNEPLDLRPDLHVLFGDPEDKNEGDEVKKSLTFLFDADYGMRIPETSSVEFKNINIDFGEHALNSFIEVYGKLIINENVYFKNICTCTKHVIYVRSGGTLIWRGGKNSIPGVVIYNDGGTVIYGGGDSYGTTYGVHNINDGTVIIKGGSVGGADYAIYNPSYGEIHLYDGCHIDGNVYSNGNITTGGSVGLGNIYIPWNCHVNLTSSITTNWTINIQNIQNIKVPLEFIFGLDGYRLTEEDLKNINTNLPDNYCLVLDISLNIIFIVDSCSDKILGNIMNATNVVDRIYSLDGSQTENRYGINIVRYSNGTIHKVVYK